MNNENGFQTGIDINIGIMFKNIYGREFEYEFLKFISNCTQFISKRRLK